MKINLKIRALTAYCSPSKALLADNEDITISVLDKGQLQGKVVLLCNGKSYAADGDKNITLPRDDLKDVNVLELTELDETDKVVKRFVCENLYVIACSKEYGGSRLLAERAFYQETVTALLAEVRTLNVSQKKLEQRQADLENGKFTMLKFGGNKQ